MASFTTDEQALTALRNVAAQQAEMGVRSEGEHRTAFVAERLDHYRRFNITEVEVRRLALRDAHTRF